MGVFYSGVSTCQKKIIINKDVQSICDESLDDDVYEDDDGDLIPLSVNSPERSNRNI